VLARGIHFFVEKHKHLQSFGLVNSGVWAAVGRAADHLPGNGRPNSRGQRAARTDATECIQTHARLEFAHPLLRRFAPLLSPDWDCLVDGKLVGLFFASPVYAKHNGTAFILKQMMSQEGQTMKLPEEEQAIRPKLHRYKLKERSVEIFLTEKDHPSEPQGWTCLLTGNWWGLGFEVVVRRNRTLSFMLRNRLESLRGCECAPKLGRILFHL
jgi:hypothetical protein